MWRAPYTNEFALETLEIGWDFMPTPQGWEGNYAYFYRCKNPPTIEE